MQTEPAMRYESKEQMLQIAEDTIERSYKPLDKWFTVFPKSPCKVLPTPESEQHAPPAYYVAPLPDGSRDGTYFPILTSLKLKASLRQSLLHFMKLFQAII